MQPVHLISQVVTARTIHETSQVYIFRRGLGMDGLLRLDAILDTFGPFCGHFQHV